MSDETKVEEAKTETETAIAVVEANVVVPAMTVTPDPQLAALEQSRQTLLTSLTTLRDRVDTPEAQEDLKKLCRTCNPAKKGREEIATTWEPPTIRIVQNMTRDKPTGSQVGDLYTTSSVVLKRPFKCTPLYIYEQNRMFPEQGTKAPLCSAPDARLGSTFGYCDKCPNLPLGKNPTGKYTQCDNGISFIVLGSDMQIYRVDFFKMSKRAGTTFSRMTDAWETVWDQWVLIDTKEMTWEGGAPYHVYTVGAHNESVASHVQEACDTIYEMVALMRRTHVENHWKRVLSGMKAAAEVKEVSSVDSTGTPSTGGPVPNQNPDVENLL